jgi:hypothetical protein
MFEGGRSPLSKILFASTAIVLGAVSLWFGWYMEKAQAFRSAERRVAICGHPLDRQTIRRGVEKFHEQDSWGYSADAFVDSVCRKTGR